GVALNTVVHLIIVIAKLTGALPNWWEMPSIINPEPTRPPAAAPEIVIPLKLKALQPIVESVFSHGFHLAKRIIIEEAEEPGPYWENPTTLHVRLSHHAVRHDLTSKLSTDVSQVPRELRAIVEPFEDWPGSPETSPEHLSQAMDDNLKPYFDRL